jgi:hypothetical protein
MTDEIKALLHSPAMIVFLLGVVGAVVGWGVRQEFINSNQQHQIDAAIERIDLFGRVIRLEGRVEVLEKTKPGH